MESLPGRTGVHLDETFFNRPTLAVARALLGAKLVRRLNGHLLSGLIVETEAYIGRDDTACHAHKGYTPRTAIMFGRAGVAYVYLVYGMHHMLNIVTEAEDQPCAVLIRAIEPVTGRTHMQAHRGQHHRNLTNGPARLCQALAIDRTFNGLGLCRANGLWLEPGRSIPEALVSTGPRVGIGYAAPKDQQAPWRFRVSNNENVSKR